MDLSSSSRLGYGLGTLKTRFARGAAVHNFLTASAWSLPHRNPDRMAQQVGVYGARLQGLFDRLSFGAHSLQSLRFLRPSLPLSLRA
jgi:hypothetical protein